MEIVAALRAQAAACARIGSPMYAGLLEDIARDVAAGGLAATVLRGYENEPGPSAMGLRLLGSVHRLVLERRAGALATFYPSVGGTWLREPGWLAFREVLEEQRTAVRGWLHQPPQTNEPGRGDALHGGLLHVPEPARLPVHLLEIGASAGLNLLADRAPHHPGLGPRPEPWPGMRFAEAAGCDVAPLDATTTQGRLTLTAYVWPDQAERHERLRAALDLARDRPPVVRRESAVEAVERLDLVPGRLTVLWHSVMWQYLARAEQQRIEAAVEALGASATADAPFAHLRLEPEGRGDIVRRDHAIRLDLWAGDVQVHRVLGSAPAHGVPCRWEG